MRTQTIFTAYKAIQQAWDNNVSMSDIYHMIVDWMETWQPEIRFPELAGLVEEYLQRCEDGDETYDLVEEFIYGERYAILRHICSK